MHFMGKLQEKCILAAKNRDIRNIMKDFIQNT